LVAVTCQDVLPIQVLTGSGVE